MSLRFRLVGFMVMGFLFIGFRVGGVACTGLHTWTYRALKN